MRTNGDRRSVLERRVRGQMRVLVTGGAGRLGIKVCESFLHDGLQVRVLDLDTARNRERLEALGTKAEVLWGDVTCPESVQEALQGADAVVHMAGLLPPITDERPELATRVNVGGTRVVIEALKERGDSIPFVYTSSIVVFGATPDATEPLNPDKHPPNPQEVYAETKRQCEDLIRASGIDYIILRMSAAFDLDMSAVKLMFRLPLTNRFQFCHPDNVVLAIVNAVKRFEAAKGNTLVISGGPGERMTYGDVLRGALAVLGLPVPPAHKFSQEPYCIDWYDTRKAQELLDFQQKTFADFRRDMARDFSRRYSPLFVPLMRYFIGPVFGRIIVRLF